MAKFVDAERDADDLAKLVNEDTEVTTRYGDNPKRSWKFLEGEFDTLLAGFSVQGDAAIDAINADVVTVDNARIAAQSAINSDVVVVDNAKDAALTSINSNKVIVQQAADSVDDLIDELTSNYNLTPAFDFVDGFTIQTRNQAGKDADGNYWIYNGSLPFEVTAGTTPSEPDYKQVTFNSSDNISTVDGNLTESLKIRATDEALWGDRFIGYFADGVVYTSDSDIAKWEDGNYYSYIGGDSYPVSVNSGVNPTENPVLYGKIAIDMGRDKYTRMVSVDSYGAAGDGVTDDTAALQALAADAVSNGWGVYAPPGKTYRVTDTVNLRFIPVQFLGVISAPDGVLALKLGGNASTRVNPPQFVYSVRWDDPSYWKVATTPQVQILGMKGQSITLENCDYVQFYQSGDTGTDYSQAYSWYRGVHNKFVQIDSGDGSGGVHDGWFNENEMHFTSIYYFEITEKNYKHNNNRIYGGTFEGNGKGDGVVKRLGNCSNNKFSDMRYEGNPKIIFSDKASRNTVEVTWNSAVPTSPVDVEDYGDWNVVYNTQDNGKTITNLLNVTAKNLFTFPDGSNHLNGLANLSVSGNFITATSFKLLYQSELIPAKECPEIGAFMQNVQSGGIRINLTAYDSNLNVITSSDEDYRQVGTGVVHSFQPETGGSFYPSSNSAAGDAVFVKQTGSSKAAYVRINVLSGGDGVSCGSFCVYARTNTSGLYTQRIGTGKNIGVPAPATQRTIALPQAFQPIMSSVSIAAGVVNEQSFTYSGLGLAKDMPCSCAPDADHSSDNAGLVFEAYVSGLSEITVRTTNVTAGALPIASGTRPRVTVFTQYKENF